MRTRPGLQYLALMLPTIGAGIAVRFAPLGLPSSVVKYGGSALWAVTIFWLVSALLSRRSPVVRTGLAGAAATAVEFLKLVHTPALEIFRSTLAGVLLLGRYFSTRDILAYWLAIVSAAFLDFASLRRGPDATLR